LFGSGGELFKLTANLARQFHRDRAVVPDKARRKALSVETIAIVHSAFGKALRHIRHRPLVLKQNALGEPLRYVDPSAVTASKVSEKLRKIFVIGIGRLPLARAPTERLWQRIVGLEHDFWCLPPSLRKARHFGSTVVL
jgi:hypothetical protein